jgi:hypothetical protein
MGGILGIIIGSVATGYSSTAVIKQRSGGGLKVTDNKILTGQNGFQLLIPSNVNTGVLIFEGNSVEGQTLHCLQMGYETGATSSSFVRTIINDNEFEPNNCTGDAIVLDGSIIPNSMKDVVFQGNIISGAPNTVNSLYINGITNIDVSGNKIDGGNRGISIGSYTTNISVHDNMILKTYTTSITNTGYAGMYTDQCSNIKHTIYGHFANSSKTNPVNVLLASFGSSPANAYFKLTLETTGVINSPAAEKFYVHQEYLVYNTTNGSYFNSFTLINSVSSGLPVTLTYNANGEITITRNDSYADGTYSISGTVKAIIDGMPYNVGNTVITNG